MEFAILVYDGFDDLDAFGPFEVFSHAQRAGADLQAGLYTLEAAETVETAHGLTVKPDGAVPDAPDVVVVPGGGWSTERTASARGEYERGEIPEALATYHEQGAVVASVCTGAMLLAKAGLTDGRPAITHHSARADLDASGAEIVAQRVVDDGDIVTAGGITSGIDLALHLVGREFGTEIAKRVAETMEYEPQDSSCIE
ncbi:DJ-1/PfpI family protein [Halovenus aranensis]|uniref:DJ-1/PfpI family protein n=1 Tax=Halovenus aranensis TaxID=890420 RepID=A0A1G8TU75_9EURY|nr:DJ-1/PfpI family protein [Halovenus aranensis]SDJ45023.1 DJ-1/PfpI family protein [Halovenus aranensis]